MKNNLENSFRESLKNFEMPYNSAAWTSMSAKLDAKMPVKASKTKWYAAAGIILAAIITSTLFLFSTNENSQKTVVAKTNDLNTSFKKEKSNETKSTVARTNETTKSGVTEQTKNNNQSTEINKTEAHSTEETPISSSNVVHKEEKTTTKNEPQNNRSEPSEQIISHQKTAPEDLIIPSISSACTGETIEIKNVNDAEIIIGGPWFSQIIEPHSTVKVTFKNEGTYIIGPEEADGGKNLKTFTIHPLPNVDFTIDNEIKYDGGLPTIRLISNTSQNTSWKYGANTDEGNEINPIFFKKGDYPVTLTVKDNNGCTNLIEKNIYIEEDYNLLAVNSFIPQDNDIRRNTFMPYALTQRKDVKFTLIVIDPSDGHIIFQTKDATAAWTGVDQQTGQFVKFEKAYIWKVIITNPVQGEKGNYAGTITPLTR